MSIIYKNKDFNEIYGFDPFAAIPWKKGLLYFFLCIILAITVLTVYNNATQSV